MNCEHNQWSLLADAYQDMLRHDWQKADMLLAKAMECGSKYLIEVLQLRGRVRKELLDYRGAAACVNGAWELLQTSKDKGTKKFQRDLANDVGCYNRNVGQMDLSAKGYAALGELSECAKDVAAGFGSYIYALLCSIDNREVVYDELCKFEKLLQPWVQDKLPALHERIQGKKIHIAYLSPDFRQHVMFNFYYVMLAQYNKDEFYVSCFSLNREQDGFTMHLKSLVDAWYDVADVGYRELAARIRDAGVDVLVDLAGHSAGSGLSVFAYRAAPVQISGLGWMEATGLSETDYLLTDRYLDPDVGNSMHEQPLYLNSQFCYAGRSDVPAPQGTPCLKTGYITFGVFNHYYKFTDDVIKVWKRIMDIMPESRLLLKCQMYISRSAVTMAQERFASLGMDLQRLAFEPATSNYMERYLDVDIALDTFPYTGGGTTMDALYMGVPVISKYGDRRGTRFGLSILANAGLQELAVSDWDDYVDKAVLLAGDKKFLNHLHLTLREKIKHSYIMNGKEYMKELETAYKNICRENGL